MDNNDPENSQSNDYETEDQMKRCTESYMQLTSLMSQCSADVVESLRPSQENLIGLLQALNANRSHDSKCVGYIGSTVRMFDRSLDAVLVTDIKSDSELDYCYVKWLRPRNVYELRSSGVKILSSSVQPADNLLENGTCLRPGDAVLAKNKMGYWKQGIIRSSRVIDNSNIFTISCTSDSSQFDVPNLPSDIVLYQKTTVHSNHDESESDTYSSSSDSMMSDDERNIKRPLINFDQGSSSIGSSKGLKQLVSSGYVLGGWERHTKGNALSY